MGFHSNNSTVMPHNYTWECVANNVVFVLYSTDGPLYLGRVHTNADQQSVLPLKFVD